MTEKKEETVGVRLILPSGCKILVGPLDAVADEVQRLIHLESDIGTSYYEYFKPQQGEHHDKNNTVSALNH